MKNINPVMQNFTDRVSLLGSTFQCQCGRQHSIPTRKIVLERKDVFSLPKVIEELNLGRTTLLVADRNTYEVCGSKICDLLHESNWQVESFVFQSDVKADEESVSLLSRQLQKKLDFLIAVGSGTINDITKYTSTQAKLPYIICPTAPSMNGYTSPIASLAVKGLKRTIPATPPVAVIGDLDVLSQAPQEMIAAGLGDLVSKSVSNADWQVASIVKGEYFCPLPYELVQSLEDLYIKDLNRLAERDPDIIRALTESLLYSGISMIIAGSSSPASGGEHLISHFLDFRAPLFKRKLSLHGAQVGVSTLVASALYKRILELDISKIELSRLYSRHVSLKEAEKHIRQFYGAIGSEVIKEYRNKYLNKSKKNKELKLVLSNWDRIIHAIRSSLRPPSEIRKLLQQAGAPTTAKELGIPLAEFREAVLHAKEIRERYTVLDLAFDVGLLPDSADEVIAESGIGG